MKFLNFFAKSALFRTLIHIFTVDKPTFSTLSVQNNSFQRLLLSHIQYCYVDKSDFSTHFSTLRHTAIAGFQQFFHHFAFFFV